MKYGHSRVPGSAFPRASEAGHGTAHCHDPLTAIASQVNAAAQRFGPPPNRDTIARLSDVGARVVIGRGSEYMPGFRPAVTPAQVGQIVVCAERLLAAKYYCSQCATGCVKTSSIGTPSPKASAKAAVPA